MSWESTRKSWLEDGTRTNLIISLSSKNCSKFLKETKFVLKEAPIILNLCALGRPFTLLTL